MVDELAKINDLTGGPHDQRILYFGIKARWASLKKASDYEIFNTCSHLGRFRQCRQAVYIAYTSSGLHLLYEWFAGVYIYIKSNKILLIHAALLFIVL